MVERKTFDVVVAGCGIAGLSAAVSASEERAKVVVVERATREERGGNTRWTEAFMRMKNDSDVADDFEEHFMANSGSHLDPSLIAETTRPYERWPSIVKALSFTDPEVIGTLAAERDRGRRHVRADVQAKRYAELRRGLLGSAHARCIRRMARAPQ